MSRSRYLTGFRPLESYPIGHQNVTSDPSASCFCSISGTCAKFWHSTQESSKMMNESNSNQINNETVTAALNAILTTDKFSASPQMSAFLKYVVEQTLLGNTRRIKAFTVGIEALGKSSSFDPQTDPSVRVLAKRLRSSLDAYYEQNPNTSIFIEMKPGSYIPKFLSRSEMAPAMDISGAPTVGYQHTATTANSLPMGASVPASSAINTTTGANAHVSVPQTQTVAESSTEAEADADAEANNPELSEEAKRKAGISQLWQSYKSASKVA